MVQKKKSFTFEVDADSSVPIWAQLRNRIVFLIDSGFYKPGDQLPYIRELAADIAINFNTVNKAYLSLQSDGYLKSVRGKGVFVSEELVRADTVSSKNLDAILDDCLHACRKLGLSYDEAVAEMAIRAKQLKMREATPRRVPGSNVIVLEMQDDCEANQPEDAALGA